jgi:hypothetical protein
MGLWDELGRTTREAVAASPDGLASLWSPGLADEVRPAARTAPHSMHRMQLMAPPFSLAASSVPAGASAAVAAAAGACRRAVGRGAVAGRSALARAGLPGHRARRSHKVRAWTRSAGAPPAAPSQTAMRTGPGSQSHASVRPDRERWLEDEQAAELAMAAVATNSLDRAVYYARRCYESVSARWAALSPLMLTARHRYARPTFSLSLSLPLCASHAVGPSGCCRGCKWRWRWKSTTH